MECKKCYGYGYRFWIRRSSGRSSTNLSPVAPPNSPILSVLVSVIIYSAFCDLQSLSYTHTSSSIPPLVNLAPSVSSSTSSSCRSGSPRTPIASFPPGTNIPWEVWGLQSTRWLEECITADWVSIYGLRTAESIRVPKRRDRNFQPNPVCSSLCGCYDIFLLPRFLPTLSCRSVEMSKCALDLSYSLTESTYILSLQTPKYLLAWPQALPSNALVNWELAFTYIDGVCNVWWSWYGEHTLSSEGVQCKGIAAAWRIGTSSFYWNKLRLAING